MRSGNTLHNVVQVPDRGSTFLFTLPAMDVQPVPVETPGFSSVDGPSQSTRRRLRLCGGSLRFLPRVAAILPNAEDDAAGSRVARMNAAIERAFKVTAQSETIMAI
jgi:hypothetical protein